MPDPSSTRPNGPLGPLKTDPRYVGVDVGTSATKAVLLDSTGGTVSVAERRTQLRRRGGGRVEQAVEDVLHSVASVLADVLGCLDGPRPELLAITGQGDGCWLVDERGHGVRPAVSWLDARAGGVFDRWRRDGTMTALYRINGNALFPGAQACILRWLEENEPAALDRSATAAYCKDVILQRLTGLRATDPSDASLPFGDTRGGYSAEALARCGLDHRAGLLAPVHNPLPSAPLSAAGAALTDLPEGTTVSGGPFDIAACAAGAGVTEVGDGLLIIGTTLACQVLVDGLDVDGPVAGMHLATASPDRWLRVLPAMVGTASLDWVLDLLGMAHDQVDAALSGTEPGAGGVEVLPYFAPSGERAPFVDPNARGQLTGLRLSTTRADVVRAACEATAFAARDCFAAARLGERLLVCGGGARSRPWLQIFADMLRRPLHVARPNVGARGTVLSALAATGQPIDTAPWTATTDVVEPRRDVADVYDEGFERYLRHRAAAEPLWRTA